MTTFKKHPEFDLLLDFIFDILYIIEGLYSGQFKEFEEVLSKYDNPEEYIKELIKFRNKYQNIIHYYSD